MRIRTLPAFIAATVSVLVASTASTSAFSALCPGNLGPSTTPTSAFVVNANGTVTHTETALMWKQCNEGASAAGCATGAATTATWAAALTAARSSTFAGFSDWRLPNKQELESLVDTTCYAPATNDTVFPGTVSNWTWTSTTWDGGSAFAWAILFLNGYSNADPKTTGSYAIRLVRGGTSFDRLDVRPCRLDMDGDGTVSTAIDGLLLVRHLLNISGTPLLGGIAGFPAGATRTTPTALSNYMASLNLDIDGGGGTPEAATDGMIVLRAMLGITGAAVTAGLPIPANVLRKDWSTIAPYLRDVCLMPVVQ